MTERIYNFGAGPAVLPEPVLEEAQRDLMALPGVGMSILEISHRSKAFDAIIQGCEADIRRLANIPPEYQVLFLQGGASMQFSMVPMNLLPAGGKADYVVTGSWSKKAVKEAQKAGTAHVACTTEADNCNRIPAQSELMRRDWWRRSGRITNLPERGWMPNSGREKTRTTVHPAMRHIARTRALARSRELRFAR